MPLYHCTIAISLSILLQYNTEYYCTDRLFHYSIIAREHIVCSQIFLHIFSTTRKSKGIREELIARQIALTKHDPNRDKYHFSLFNI